MPVVPQPADITRYNRWADANGQPRWGAAAPAAKAQAKARGRPPAVIQNPTPQPAAHGVMQAGDGGGFLRGTYHRGLTMYARRSNGEEVELMVWRPRLNEWQTREAGREYYRHNRQQFIVNVEVDAYKYNQRYGTFVAVGIDPQTFPLEGQDFTEAPDLDQGLDAAQALVRQQVIDWIRTQPTVQTEHGEKFQLHIESELVWVWKEDAELTFDAKIVRHVYNNMGRSTLRPS